MAIWSHRLGHSTLFGDLYSLLISSKNHGACRDFPNCLKSHDIELILDEEGWCLSLRDGEKSRQATGHQRGHKEYDDEGDNDSVRRDRKRLRTSLETSPISSTSNQPTQNTATTPCRVGTPHSASFDAYMTGYIHLHQRSALCTLSASPTTSVPVPSYPSSSPTTPGGHKEFVAKYGNKIYVVGKDIPLLLEKSRYSGLSEGWEKVRKQWEATAAQE